MSGEHRVMPTRDGYDLWAATYDTMGNWRLAPAEPEVDGFIRASVPSLSG